MPIIKSAKKAARQAEKRTEHNVQIKKIIKELQNLPDHDFLTQFY